MINGPNTARRIGRKGQAEHIFSDLIPGIILILIGVGAIHFFGGEREKNIVEMVEDAGRGVQAEIWFVNLMKSFVDYNGKNITVLDLVNVLYGGGIGFEDFEEKVKESSFVGGCYDVELESFRKITNCSPTISIEEASRRTSVFEADIMLWGGKMKNVKFVVYGQAKNLMDAGTI